MTMKHRGFWTVVAIIFIPIYLIIYFFKGLLKESNV